MPAMASPNNSSASVSSLISMRSFPVLMEAKDKMLENVKKSATIAVNSSMCVLLCLAEICNEVISRRQKPIRLVHVPKICGEVLLGIM